MLINMLMIILNVNYIIINLIIEPRELHILHAKESFRVAASRAFAEGSGWDGHHG